MNASGDSTQAADRPSDQTTSRDGYDPSNRSTRPSIDSDTRDSPRASALDQSTPAEDHSNRAARSELPSAAESSADTNSAKPSGQDGTSRQDSNRPPIPPQEKPPSEIRSRDAVLTTAEAGPGAGGQVPGIPILTRPGNPQLAKPKGG